MPTIVDICVDRPAVIPEISAKAKGLLGDVGASDAAVPDVIFVKAKPGGKLPFELPSSMDAVRNQETDVPHDSKDPLYKFRFGLSYRSVGMPAIAHKPASEICRSENIGRSSP